ncbi:ABC-type nitrate/sulfonate/bicarbonate transport system, periplasmic component [Candidatus Methanoperedens nitroreducens]|uniref:ABC-type nitrate/sulfonate/bicarbonate transport system, periplasmic component n=1 Tax=Candidatus Methanoperedens nitratireducens TaxID=1392998 RepID=A0A062UYZ6_9EURY|nr:ABC transporter substrate-binding protein [Candidatus Methanoperedens nitroreducens]KCZ72156.1 ABC-type nitrate/sulfonate/bicarbonate transport system, periplasmic component [Candidatus Methanoperedens nitroreducens]MDJ1421867.1 ABC transporter substrate-binding protein [Candidatus Methanoperedens sp.]
MLNPDPINIGHLSTAYHTSFILMGTDWLDKAGIHANWKLFASGPDIVKAFESEEIDIGYIGLPPAIIGIDRGVQIICIAGGHVEGTVLIARREYRTLDDLMDLNAVLLQFEGKVIGSPPRGSIHDVIINNALEEAKFKIKVRNFAWTDFVLEALVDGEIDAAVGTPSLAVAAARACSAKIIVPPYRLWPNNPSYGIVIRKELMQYPDVIPGFLNMHEQASNFIRTKPEDAAGIVSKLTGIVDEDFILDAYRVSPKYCAALSSDFVGSTMSFVPVLHRLKYISRNLSESEIFEHGFIEKVHKELPHYNL